MDLPIWPFGQNVWSEWAICASEWAFAHPVYMQRIALVWTNDSESPADLWKHCAPNWRSRPSSVSKVVWSVLLDSDCLINAAVRVDMRH